MTKEEIEKMKPGRKLDLLVSKYIFDEMGYELADQVPPEYSTEIEDVWKIIKEMITRKYWCEIKSPFNEESDWYVGFTPFDNTGWNGRPDNQISGKTAPEAICKAALSTIAV